MTISLGPQRARRLVAAIPAVFVVLWSTGFIFAGVGTRYAEPLTFLGWRYVAVLALLLPIALATGAPWPKSRAEAGHIAVTGMLVHGLYLGGVFVAVRGGMPAGLASLIVALQPLLTAALVGPALGERVGRLQLVGLLLGFVGVAIVLAARVDGDAVTLFRGFGLAQLGAVTVSLAAITIGVVYQKRYCAHFDLRTGTLIQYLAAAAITWPAALLFETNRVAWTGEFIFALGWLVLVLSIGAISLLNILVRTGEAAKTASYFYLVPPVTALIAYFVLGEGFSPIGLAGMGLAALGVALAVRRA